MARTKTLQEQDELVAAIIGPDVEENITRADVDAAERTAQEAEQALGLLEQRIADGTDTTTTPEEFEAQRGKSRFARLLAKGAARRAERAARAQRLRACDNLRREIEAYVGGSGERFADLLRQVHDATRQFVAAVDERNRHVYGWNQRAQKLDVPAHVLPVMPPREHAHLGVTGTAQSAGVVAGLRRLELAEPVHFLRMIMANVRSESTGNPEAVVTNMTGMSVDQACEIVSTLDGSREPLPEDTLFFRGENGALLHFAPDHLPPDHVLTTLTPMSRKDIER